MSTTSLARAPRPLRLAAAVALGLGVIGTAMPAAALPAADAAPSEALAGPRDCAHAASGVRAAQLFLLGPADAGAMPFHTLQRVSADRIQAFVSAEAGSVSVGPLLPVPAELIHYDPRLQDGTVDVTAARALLGVPAEQDVMIRLAVDGAFQDCQTFGLDPDHPALQDLGRYRTTFGFGIVWENYPAAFDSTWVLTPGQEVFGTEGLFTYSASGMRLREEPRHGQLHRVTYDLSRTHPGTILGPVDGQLAYRPDAGFTGEDSFVLEWVLDGEVKTERVTVRVGEATASRLPYQHAPEGILWPGERLHAEGDPDSAPSPETAPSAPVSPAPSAPVSPAGPAPAETPSAHETPATVQTGDTTAWGLLPGGALLAAAAAAVGLRARRA